MNELKCPFAILFLFVFVFKFELFIYIYIYIYKQFLHPDLSTYHRSHHCWLHITTSPPFLCQVVIDRLPEWIPLQQLLDPSHCISLVAFHSNQV
jgi:hypothetical protein